MEFSKKKTIRNVLKLLLSDRHQKEVLVLDQFSMWFVEGQGNRISTLGVLIMNNI